MSSGSRGNAVYIESETTRILLDAGLSHRELVARFAAIERDPADLDAVFLTHEHSDHVRGVGPLVRKYGTPLFTTEGTFSKAQRLLGRIPIWNRIRADEPVDFGELSVEPYATSHDAQESVAFVIRSGSLKLGHATDLGMVTPLVREKLREADALLLEANHDVKMLDDGPYPWTVKQRIKSNVGHLSNDASADLLASVCHSGLRLVMLMHMSQANNSQQIAGALSRQALGGVAAELLVAGQDAPTRLITL